MLIRQVMEHTNGASKPRYGEIKAKLQSFLDNNIVSQLVEPDSTGTSIDITAPWGDQSLTLRIPTSGEDQLIDALNNIYLPERFTAIWHRDTEQFEIIYGPIRISLPEASRSFLFKHRGKDYDCTYREASERLRLLARFHRITGLSNTQYRNLP